MDHNVTVLTKEQIIFELRNATFLITGATGMIGRNFVRNLLEMNDMYNAGIKIVAHVRDMQKADQIYFQEQRREDFKLIKDDIINLKVVDNIDYIVHAASVTGGSKQHFDLPVRTISTSLEGTKNILDIAQMKKVRGIVFLSSLEVYGNTGMDKRYICETDGGYIDPVNVRSSYSESKRMCECMFASYAKQYKIPAIVARLTVSFGYGVSYGDDRVFAQFAKSILEKKDIVLKSEGKTVRDYCDTEDVVTALLTILLRGTPGAAYNVANMDTEISIRDLALKFIELYPESGISLRFDLNEDVVKLGYNKTMRNVLDSHKLMKLGWQPQFGIEDMIHHLVDSMAVAGKKQVEKE